MVLPKKTFRIFRSGATAIRLLLPAAALMAAAGAHAEIYKQLDSGWSIETQDDGCVASAVFGDDKLFMVKYYPRDETIRLTVLHPDATSLNDGDTVEMYVKFVVGNSLDNGWGKKKFDVGVISDGSRFLTSTFDAYDMLRDIARADRIAFTLDEYSDRIIAVFDLSGTSVMTKELRECSLKAVGLNPKDPFLG